MLLKGWMSNTGTSLEELATKVGISVPHLCNIANGHTVPKSEILEKLAKATKLDSAELLEDCQRMQRERKG